MLQPGIATVRHMSWAWIRLGRFAVLPLCAILAGAGEAPAVIVAPVQVKDVAPVQTFVGQVQAIQSVNVVARVQAFIDKVDFTEGSTVAAGQLLFALQKGPYQAAVLQAQGSFAQAQATLQNAAMNLQRDTQAGNLAISQQQIQQDTAARDQAAGQVDTARGALEAAAINLSYCTVVAPIAGRIGRANITAGNLVDTTSGPLATIVQMDPIRVYFAPTDSELLSIQQQTGKTSAELAATVALHLRLSNGATYKEAGKIEFLNNQVDPSTGTLTVWGRFANPDSTLTPGAFVTVEVAPAQPEVRPVVAVQAVQNDANGPFVLLVDQGNKVQEQRIKLGRQIGQQYIVQSGLTGGERVITEGIQKVHAGQAVSASTAQPLPATPSPTGGGT